MNFVLLMENNSYIRMFSIWDWSLIWWISLCRKRNERSGQKWTENLVLKGWSCIHYKNQKLFHIAAIISREGAKRLFIDSITLWFSLFLCSWKSRVVYICSCKPFSLHVWNRSSVMVSKWIICFKDEANLYLSLTVQSFSLKNNII